MTFETDSKAELEKTLEFPKGTTPDDLAEALTQTVSITYKRRP